MLRIAQFGLKMTSIETVKKSETRAVAAEQLIQMLRSQINEIRSFSNQEKSQGSSEDQEIKTLALENAQLKQKILEQKALLVAVETKAGVKQVTSDVRGRFWYDIWIQYLVTLQFILTERHIWSFISSWLIGKTESKPPSEVPEKVKDTQEDSKPDTTTVDKKTEKKKKEKAEKKPQPVTEEAKIDVGR